MHVRSVAVTSRGRLTLPAEVRRAMEGGPGTEFVLVQEGHRILLLPARRAGQILMDHPRRPEPVLMRSFLAVWKNPEDDVWDTFGETPSGDP